MTRPSSNVRGSPVPDETASKTLRAATLKKAFCRSGSAMSAYTWLSSSWTALSALSSRSPGADRPGAAQQVGQRDGVDGDDAVDPVTVGAAVHPGDQLGRAREVRGEVHVLREASEAGTEHVPLLRGQRRRGTTEVADGRRVVLPAQREPAPVGGDRRERAGDAAGGPDLRVVLEEEEVGPTAVAAQHRRQQPDGARGAVGQVRSVGDARLQLLHRGGDLRRQRCGVDPLDPVGLGGEPARGAHHGGLAGRDRGEVDAAVHRAQAVGTQRPGGGHDVGQHPVGQPLRGQCDGADRLDVGPDLREPRGDPPRRAPGVPHRGAGVRPGVGQRGPCARLVAGRELAAQGVEVLGDLLELGPGLERLPAGETHQQEPQQAEQGQRETQPSRRPVTSAHDQQTSRGEQQLRPAPDGGAPAG